MGNFDKGNKRFGRRGHSSFDRGEGKRGFRKSFGPKEMHKVICSECGNECEVPFKPTKGKPVYCRECFMKHKKF